MNKVMAIVELHVMVIVVDTCKLGYVKGTQRGQYYHAVQGKIIKVLGT
jgi:hypothetical protein